MKIATSKDRIVQIVDPQTAKWRVVEKGAPQSALWDTTEPRPGIPIAPRCWDHYQASLGNMRSVATPSAPQAEEAVEEAAVPHDRAGVSTDQPPMSTLTLAGQFKRNLLAIKDGVWGLIKMVAFVLFWLWLLAVVWSYWDGAIYGP